MKNKKFKKNVYLAFSSDIIYKSHEKIFKKASKIGNLTIGLLTDNAIIQYKSLPHLNYEEREKKLLKYKKYIFKIIPQNELDYSENLKKLKPDYVLHGDDWKKGIQKKTREKIIKLLKKWSGKLIEFPYDYNFPKNEIKKFNKKIGTNPENRRSKIKRLLNCDNIIRLIETHTPITGLIGENIFYAKNDTYREFNGFWSSSLTDSLVRGKPDNQSVDYSTRINNLSEILEVTTKPMIFDGDNGGNTIHIPYMIRNLERNGVSGIIIEDKIGIKKNSLFKKQKKSSQDSIKAFCNKLKIACESRISKDFLIIARIESLVLEKSMNDAIKRAIEYVKAGSDLIYLSSKKNNPSQMIEFSKKFQKTKYFRYLACSPSTYSKTNEKILEKYKYKIVIYANHLFRSAYPAMTDTAYSILKNRRAYETEKKLITIKDVIRFF